MNLSQLLRSQGASSLNTWSATFRSLSAAFGLEIRIGRTSPNQRLRTKIEPSRLVIFEKLLPISPYYQELLLFIIIIGSPQTNSGTCFFFWNTYFKGIIRMVKKVVTHAREVEHNNTNRKKRARRRRREVEERTISLEVTKKMEKKRTRMRTASGVM